MFMPTGKLGLACYQYRGHGNALAGLQSGRHVQHQADGADLHHCLSAGRAQDPSPPQRRLSCRACRTSGRAPAGTPFRPQHLKCKGLQVQHQACSEQHHALDWQASLHCGGAGEGPAENPDAPKCSKPRQEGKLLLWSQVMLCPGSYNSSGNCRRSPPRPPRGCWR